ISLAGVETDELEKLINAIRVAYLREAVDKDRGTRRERMNFLGEVIQKYDDQLKVARETQNTYEEQFGGKRAHDRARMLALLDTQLSADEAELLTARSELRQARLQLRALQTREKGTQAAKVPDQEVAEALSREPEIAEAKAEVRRLERRIVQAVQRSPGGKEDSAVLQAEKEVAALRRKVEETAARLRLEVVKQLQERG